MSVLVIEFPCSECGSAVMAAPDSTMAACKVCGRQAVLTPDDASRAGGPVERCSVCRVDQFYLQKDFNRRLGLWVVLVSAVGSFFIYARWGPWALAFLGVVTLADWIVYKILPEVAVCYYCGAIYRGFAKHPRHRAFDLHVAGVFSKKR